MDLQILQQSPANTTSFMIAGYAIIFGMMLVYVLSLIIRWHKLKQEVEVLGEMGA